MKHEFDKVAILCTTDEQILHLAEINGHSFNITRTAHYPYFRQDRIMPEKYSNFECAGGKPVVTYEDFIAGVQEPDTQVVEVTGCRGCPFSDGFGNTEWCNHPEHDNKSDSLFSTCPLKEGQVTIKLKQ